MADNMFDRADYTLTSDGIEGDAVRDAASRARERKEERRRRKLRERMMSLMAGMGGSTPRAQAPVGVSVRGAMRSLEDVGDDRMSGGVSLALGSDAHKEYVRERMGMDDFELERATLAEEGFGTKGDLEAPGPDEFHEERGERLAHQDDEIAEREADLSELRGKAITRAEAFRVIKGKEADSIIEMAMERAHGTASHDDDDYVDGKLRKELDEKVRNRAEVSLGNTRHRVEDTLADIAGPDV